MDVEFVRELDGNYLVLAGLSDRTVFAEKMLALGKPAGILPFRLYREGPPRLYSYEISGRSSLAGMTQTRGMEIGEIKTLLRAVYRSCEELERYLLKPENLILEPGLMYLGKDGWAFCAHPEREEDLMLQMQKLSRFILRKCDHENEETARLAYALFQLCHEENVSFPQILELLGQEEAVAAAPEASRKKAGKWFRRRKESTSL